MGGDDIRFYRQGPTIHFHDDIQQLEVVVPSDICVKMWMRILTAKGGTLDQSYADEKHGTVLFVHMTCDWTDDQQGEIHLEMSIQKARLIPDATFEALRKIMGEWP